MKKLILGGFAIVLFIAVAYLVYSFYFAERISPADTAQLSVAGIDLRIDYSQPLKKGRLIFGQESEDALLPYGEYWRLGANEATKFTLSGPVSIKGNQLEAGSYSIYAFPGEKIWTIAFNISDDHWGAFQPDEEDDVFRIEVEPQQADPFVEQMKIILEASDSRIAHIVVRWDDVELRIPVEVL